MSQHFVLNKKATRKIKPNQDLVRMVKVGSIELS